MYNRSDLVFSGIAGWLVAFMLCLSSLLHLNEKVSDANDRLARIELQYQDCRVIGDYPTNADMSHE